MLYMRLVALEISSVIRKQWHKLMSHRGLKRERGIWETGHILVSSTGTTAYWVYHNQSHYWDRMRCTGHRQCLLSWPRGAQASYTAPIRYHSIQTRADPRLTFVLSIVLQSFHLSADLSYLFTPHRLRHRLRFVFGIVDLDHNPPTMETSRDRHRQYLSH